MAKYTDEQTKQIQGFIDSYYGNRIPRTDFINLLKTFDESISEKSLAAKIRFMGGKIELKETEQAPKKFTEEETRTILEMTSNPNNMPFLEDIAEKLGKDEKVVRGKLVSLRIKGVKKRNAKGAPPKKFTEEEEAMLQELISDLDNLPFLEDIAEKLNKTPQQIKGKLASMKVKGVKSKNTKPGKEKIYTDELKEELAELVKTHSVEEIAEMKGLNFYGLRSVLGKLGLVKSAPRKVYWTEDRVNELKGYMDEGLSFQEIAQKMGKNALVIAKKVKQLEKAQAQAQVEDADALDFDTISV